MASVLCPDCGARYDADGDSCAARFDALLALDHSRQEPWGSRHGLAFAVYALQHPRTHPRSVAQAREMLTRVYRHGEPLTDVVARFRAAMGQRPAATVPTPAGRVAFAITIRDLGTFPAETYAADLDAWCRATLDAIDTLDALDAPGLTR